MGKPIGQLSMAWSIHFLQYENARSIAIILFTRCYHVSFSPYDALLRENESFGFYKDLKICISFQYVIIVVPIRGTRVFSLRLSTDCSMLSPLKKIINW